MYYYAQINNENICICISQLSSEINVKGLILLNNHDESLLGKKHIDGEWFEVEPQKRPIDIIKLEKLAEISNACQTVIFSGVDVETSQGLKHFNMSEHDQINLLGYKGELISALSGLPSEIDPKQGIWYKADGVEERHRFWNKEDFLLIASVAIKFKTEQLTYYDGLKTYVYSLNDAEAINAVYYGMELPTDLHSGRLGV